MRYFDLHCDTLYEALIKKKSMHKNDLHISIEKGIKNKPWLQCFAIWIPDEIRGNEAVNLVNDAYVYLQEQIKNSGSAIRLCNSCEDLEYVRSHKGAGAIFTVEGSATLGNDLNNIDRFKDMGVKVMTLTWNGECEVGSGIEAYPDNGLSEFGAKVISKMESAGIVVDVSHASEKLFFDVADIAQKPFIATHSNSKKICSHKRNLTDEQFKVIKDRHGLVGLTFYRRFLNDDEYKAKIDDVLCHAEHFLSLGGSNVLAIGGDFDGAEMPSDMVGIESVYDVAECFLKHNYSEELVNKILFDNAYNFFMDF